MRHGVSLGVYLTWKNSEVCVVDPTHAEEQVADGKVVMSMNKQNEICAVSKQGKVALKPEQVLNSIVSLFH